MSLKKHKLSVAIADDYCLLGIVSDEPDYKLCWLINEQLKFSLTKVNDLHLYNKKSLEEQVYPVFRYEDETTMLIYRVIANRIENGHFLAELKNIDYILHLQGEVQPEDLRKLISDLQKVQSIRMCVPVDLQKIKEKDRLQLW